MRAARVRTAAMWGREGHNSGKELHCKPAHRSDKALEWTTDVEDAANEVLNGSLPDNGVG